LSCSTVIPARTHLCMIITFVDVFHSWVVLSLGAKCDVDFEKHKVISNYLL